MKAFCDYIKYLSSLLLCVPTVSASLSLFYIKYYLHLNYYLIKEIVFIKCFTINEKDAMMVYSFFFVCYIFCSLTFLHHLHLLIHLADRHYRAKVPMFL